MTSRDRSSKKLRDSLDLMIRWALHDEATSSAPAPGVWQRIRERASEQASLSERAAWWQRLPLVAGALARGILVSPVSVPAEYAATYPPLPRYLWETAALCLPSPQGDLPMWSGPAGSSVVPLLN